MKLNRVRPRFYLNHPQKPPVLEKRLLERLQNGDGAVEGKVLRGHAVLKIPREHQHYWSPQLSISLEENDEGTYIRGLFGPKPEVWTFFMSLYAFAGFTGIVGGIFGLSQMSLGIPSFALWSVPLAASLGVVAWMMAQYGQHLGAEQMHQLREFLEAAIGEE